ncbi:MAG: biotin/lipoyl-containing protein, partial [Pseudomonadota bacterium]|nr:biotin/lipoyl-containing protein [Pseudomonadota bacterium]
MNENAKIKSETLKAPMQAVVHQLNVAVGDVVAANAELVVLEAMKMHHGLATVSGGRVVEVGVALGDVVDAGEILVRLEPAAQADEAQAEEAQIDLDHIRADLSELETRLARTLDAARPGKMGKRHEKGFRSARENVDDLCDPDSFIEYGQLVVAAQRQRRELDDLIDNTPADGLIAGFGAINGDEFSEDQARAGFLDYDYTVLAGTQGAFNQKKTDRVLELAQDWQTPI